MVFHLNLKAGQSILRNLKTIPFLLKGYKNMYTAVQGVSWIRRQNMVSDIPITNQDGVAWKITYKTKLWPVQKKPRKNLIRFPFLRGKMDVAAYFETIFPSKTLWKLNKIDRVGFIVLCSFVFSGHCLRLCHGNGKVIYLYRPFTITSLSWPNNRGNIRSSLFPPLMIRSIRPQCFRRLTHVHTCAHSQPCLLMRNMRFVINISVFFFKTLFCSLRSRDVKGRGRWWFSIYVQNVWSLRKSVQAETLDGDREKWRPGCVSGLSSEATLHGVWIIGQACPRSWISLRKLSALYEGSTLILTRMHFLLYHCSGLFRNCLLLCRIWKTK